MPTRAQIVAVALNFVGYLPEPGEYDGFSRFSVDLGRPAAEAWCANYCTDVYKLAGLPLPLMQPDMPGDQTGFAYCPSGWDYARAHGATADSYQAQPGDLVIFGFGGDFPQHVEMAVEWAEGVLTTVGGNSDGPTPHQDGGVWRHQWSAPAGVGNDDIIGIITTSKLVTFSEPPAPKPKSPPAKPAPPVPGNIAKHL